MLSSSCTTVSYTHLDVYKRQVYYYLSDDHVRAIVAQGFEHLIEESDEIGTITR